MIRAVIWKELREQGIIGLSLVVLGSGLLTAAAMLADPPSQNAPASDVIRSLGAGLLATLMLSVTAGMVCGGAVFAAEREAGTMSFLDALPVSRWRLWLAKLIAGSGLAIAQILLLIAVAAALGLLPTFGWARAVGVFSLLAFVWGFFGSTISRTTLGSVGVAIPSAVVTTIALLLPILLLSRNPGSLSVRPTEAFLFLTLMFAVPLSLSAWVFTAPDRQRSSDDASPGAERSRRPRIGIRALVWLTARQFRITGIVLAIFAVLFGLSMLPKELQPALVWPSLALAAGVLTGVTIFADEQTRGVARYWSEQRLPLGRVWVVKVGFHLLACAALLLLLIAPLAIRAQFLDRQVIREHTFLAIVFRTALFDELGHQGWKYLLVPAVYGFAAGHLCGLVFRKLVVACGVAAVVGGTAAVAWGPSVLAGGLNAWQVWLPPLVALATGRLLIHAWASERITNRGPLLRLAGGVGTSFLLLAIGLGYRVLEVPNRPDGEADVAYIASLPPFDSNRGGTGFRTAVERHARVYNSVTSELDRMNTPSNRRIRLEERLNEVFVRGWPANDPELANWFDQLYATEPDASTEPWFVAAESTLEFPIGIFEYPQLVNVTGKRDNALPNAQRMAATLLGRGLQLQAAGNPAVFVDNFRIVIALARTTRNGTIIAGYQAGRVIEELALHALDRWLENLPPQAPIIWHLLAPCPGCGPIIAARFERPDLLKAAVAILEPADSTGPFDSTSYFLAERYVMREMLKAPGQWLPRLINPPSANPDVPNPEVDLVGIAWAVPWEKERTRRLAGLGYESGLPAELGLITGRPGAGFMIRPRAPDELQEIERSLREHRRAALLKLALRAYRAEHGQYPDPDRPQPLNVLVEQNYLTRVPLDAYDETRTFEYRLGGPEGTELRPRPRTGLMRAARAGDNANAWFLAPGQAAVWTKGIPAAKPTAGMSTTTWSDDLIYLVPAGPNP